MKGMIINALCWNFFGQAGGRVMQMLVFFILARLLDKTDFGLIGIANMCIALLGTFVTNGFNESIVQRKELDKATCDTAFWTIAGMSIAVFLVCFCSAGLIADFWEAPAAVPVIRALSFQLIIIGLVMVPMALLERKLDFKSLGIRNSIAKFAGGVVGIVSAFAGFGVWSLVYMALTEAVAAFFLIWMMSDYRPGMHFIFSEARRFFKFGMNSTFLNVSTFLSNYIDQIMVGKFLGVEMLGVYTVMRKIPMFAFSGINDTFYNVFYSVYCKVSHDRTLLLGYSYKLLKVMSILAFPVYMCLAFFHREVVEICFGEKWVEYSGLLVLFAFIPVIDTVLFNLQSVYTADGRPIYKLATRLIVTGVMFAFMLGVRGEYGIYGIASAILAAYVASLPIVFALAKAKLSVEVSRLLGAAAFALVVALASFGACKLAFHWAALGGVWWNIVSIACAFALYFALVLLLARKELKAFVESLMAERKGAKIC